MIEDGVFLLFGVPAQPPRKYKPSTDRPAVIDISKRWREIAAIARSHPHFARCLRAGWDPDDLQQEILERAVRRQAQPSRYDSTRAGFGKYVFLFVGSVCANLAVLKRGMLQEEHHADGFEPRDLTDGWSYPDKKTPAHGQAVRQLRGAGRVLRRSPTA